jgi:hypothetical protein
MTASRSLAEYYHWEETDRGIRIYMHSGMADRLQAEVRGGVEAGGILLGRMEEDRGKATAFIDDFMPVPCSYRGGPLYALSDEDTVNLEAALLRTALAACKSPDAPSVLGYYRSHMRDGLWLSPADLLVIDSYFQAPDSVFLIVKTLANTKACTAGFFFWEDGHIQCEFSPLEVALGHSPSLPAALPPAAGEVTDLHDSLGDEGPAGSNDDSNLDLNGDLPEDLAALFRKAALPQPGTAPALPPAPEPEPVSPPPPAMAASPVQLGKAPRAWQGLWIRVATISIATAALVISAVTYLGTPRPPREEAAASAPDASMLGLHVDRNFPGLLVSWNRNAPEIVAARRATLSIRDGGAEKSVDLDKSQLAGGNYLYTAANDDIRFRLEVYGADDGSVAQSIRVPRGSPR